MSEATHDVRIEMDEHGRGRVLVDGVRLTAVAAVCFTARVGESNRVLIELAPKTLTLVGPAVVETEGAG